MTEEETDKIIVEAGMALATTEHNIMKKYASKLSAADFDEVFIRLFIVHSSARIASIIGIKDIPKDKSLPIIEELFKLIQKETLKALDRIEEFRMTKVEA